MMGGFKSIPAGSNLTRGGTPLIPIGFHDQGRLHQQVCLCLQPCNCSGLSCSEGTSPSFSSVHCTGPQSSQHGPSQAGAIFAANFCGLFRDFFFFFGFMVPHAAMSEIWPQSKGISPKQLPTSKWHSGSNRGRNEAQHIFLLEFICGRQGHCGEFSHKSCQGQILNQYPQPVEFSGPSECLVSY